MGRNGEDKESSVVHGVDSMIMGSVKIMFYCLCGASWSYDANATPEHMHSIFESHKNYYNRPKTETL